MQHKILGVESNKIEGSVLNRSIVSGKPAKDKENAHDRVRIWLLLYKIRSKDLN